MTPPKKYDTIIIGSGIGGTSLAAILARHGKKVLMIEKGRHPRFAIGEAAFFRACIWMWMTGRRYGVPELEHIANVEKLAEMGVPTSGLKQTFGQAYHREGRDLDPGETHNIVTPLAHFIRDTHLYRQDVDQYMLKAALKYGAEYRDRTQVLAIEFDEDGATVITDGGEAFRTRYVVDGAGYRSPLAEKFGLRDEVPNAKTHSRAIFTHMRNVRPIDEVLDEPIPGSFSLYEGTLHHVFDGGWMWIIPFDNHESSENPLCSVGLMLDSERFPRPEGVAPEDEFQAWVDRFPGIARHLEDAVPVRPFTGTGRIQYSSKSVVGPRYALLSQAQGFIDPLYSRGLIWTFENVYALAHRLIDALTDDDFSMERFEYLNGMAAAQHERADQLVHNAYRAMGHFETWNAWTRIFVAGELLNALYLWRRALHTIRTGDTAWITGLDADPKPGYETYAAGPLQEMIDTAGALFDRIDLGQIGYEMAAQELFEYLGTVKALPHPVWKFGEAAAHHVDLVLPSSLAKLIFWGKVRAPKPMRKELFDLPMGTLNRLEFEGRVLAPLRKKLFKRTGRKVTSAAV
jgi:FADH2 O2-dependent halogenase